MNDEKDFLGVVENDKFQAVMPKPRAGDVRRFTEIRPQEARSPESAELSLIKYEGSAIMIRGIDQGAWVYSASVKDTAGPIVTAVVQKVFQKKAKSPRRR